jgi:hypothetical protein
MTTVEALNIAAQSEWIPVAERLPNLPDDEVGLRETVVLIYSAFPGWESIDKAYLDKSWGNQQPYDWFCPDENFSKWDWNKVTHWRLLPEGPK